MGKKKEKGQTINNIQNLNLEIDYEKLADAIVMAQEKASSNIDKSKKYTSAALAALVSTAFSGVSILGWIFTIGVPLYVWSIWHTFQWTGYEYIFSSVITILLYVGLMSVAVVYSIVLWRAAKEVNTERDRNYIIALFSGVVSFAALIVALVALVKEVS